VRKRAKDAAQARRLLAIAAVGSTPPISAASSRKASSSSQTLRDWVIRFNEQGPNALVNIVFASNRAARLAN
jgi:hypothetical protein